MKKTLLAAAIAALTITGSAFAEEAYQRDIQLFDQQEIVIEGVAANGETVTINGMTEELGALLNIRYVTNWDDEVYMTHAFYENGEIWLEGEIAADQEAPVFRMVTWRTDTETARGLKIGDSFEKIMLLYGEPHFIHWNKLCNDDNLSVDRWFSYSCQEKYEKGTPRKDRPEETKLLVGIKGKKVTRIGYSGRWGMGL